MYNGLMAAYENADLSDMTFDKDLIDARKVIAESSSLVSEINMGLEQLSHFAELFSINPKTNYAKKATKIAIESAFKRNKIPNHISVATEEDKRGFIQKIIDWIKNKIVEFKLFYHRMFSRVLVAKREKEIQAAINGITKELKDYKGEDNSDIPSIQAAINLDLSKYLFMDADRKIITDIDQMIKGEGGLYDSFFSKSISDITRVLILKTDIDEVKSKLSETFGMQGSIAYKCVSMINYPFGVKLREDGTIEKIGFVVHNNPKEYCPEYGDYVSSEHKRKEVNKKLIMSLKKINASELMGRTEINEKEINAMVIRFDSAMNEIETDFKNDDMSEQAFKDEIAKLKIRLDIAQSTSTYAMLLDKTTVSLINKIVTAK